eukprot:07620.XXX_396864_396983_1 [CDS] Oithona nana genome sequencing.
MIGQGSNNQSNSNSNTNVYQRSNIWVVTQRSLQCTKSDQ